MHYAIEYQHFSSPLLQPGNRKRMPVGQLLRITQGAALLRLGQYEQLLTAGHSFWLCADALAALTPLRGCQHDLLTCSLRVEQPGQAGWLQTSPLLAALLDSLALWQGPRDWQGAYGQRLQVVQQELQLCPIQQQPDPTLQAAWRELASQRPAPWQQLLAERGIRDPALAGEALLCQWQVLQAVRLLKSGNKRAQVVATLGYQDEAAMAQACQHWLGFSLDQLAGL